MSALRVRFMPDMGVALALRPTTQGRQSMAGKAIGEFSFKAITITYSPGPAGSVLDQVNWEGTAKGFGVVFGTTTFVGGSKNGTFSACWVAYLDNGEQLSGIGSGTYESSGKHHWHTRHVIHISDGSNIVNEGEIDFAARSWTGKNFENS
jgi:hypothetical protein